MLQFDVAPAVAQIPHGVVVVAPSADGRRSPSRPASACATRLAAAAGENRSGTGSRRHPRLLVRQLRPVPRSRRDLDVRAGPRLRLRRRAGAADRDARRRPHRSADPPDRASHRGRQGTMRSAVPAGAWRRPTVHDLPDLAARSTGTNCGDPARLGADGRADYGARPRGHDGDRQSCPGDARAGP